MDIKSAITTLLLLTAYVVSTTQAIDDTILTPSSSEIADKVAKDIAKVQEGLNNALDIDNNVDPDDLEDTGEWVTLEEANELIIKGCT